MNTTMKTSILLAAIVLTGSLAFAQGNPASLTSPGNNSFEMPKDINRLPAPTVDFVGAQVSSGTRVVNSIPDTTKVWVKGAGLLMGVEIGSAAATNYVACFDSADATLTDPAGVTIPRLIMNCYANTTNSAQCGGGATGFGFRVPRFFSAGLLCITYSAAGTSTSYLPQWRAKSQ